MTKRRTKKQKLAAQRRATRPVVRSVRKAATEKELYFRQDLAKSLVIIGGILALELGYWWLNR